MQWNLPWYARIMKPPLYVRPLTDDERMQSEADRRTTNAFRMRRAQIVLASARGLSPQPIAQLVGGCVHTVRNVIHAFNTTGLACMAKQSTRPKSAVPTFTAPKCEQSPAYPASVPAHLWQTHGPLDARPGRPGVP